MDGPDSASPSTDDGALFDALPGVRAQLEASIGTQIVGQKAVVEAMLVDGDRIVAVGDADTLAAQAPRARRVDLEGQAVVPGFIDAHGHFPGEGAGVVFADLSSPPVGHIQTMAQLVARLQEQLTQTRPRKWVIGFGYDDTLMAEGRHPTRQDLDEVSAERPIAAVHIEAMGLFPSRAAYGLGQLAVGVTKADRHLTQTHDPSCNTIFVISDGPCTRPPANLFI